MILNGKNQIMGRVATFAAKQALLGEKVDIINCEDIIITGKKETVLAKFKRRRKMGDPFKGPFHSRLPDRIMRRTVRGMLPHKKERGRQAYKRVMCHIGTPEEYKGKEVTPIPGADYTKLKTMNFVPLRRVAKFLGKDV